MAPSRSNDKRNLVDKVFELWCCKPSNPPNTTTLRSLDPVPGCKRALLLDKTDSDLGWTPLHYAVSRSYYKKAKCLASKKKYLEAKCAQGWTPLHLAVIERFLHMTELLIINGAKIDSRDNCGWTPLHTVVINPKGGDKTTREFVDQDFAINNYRDHFEEKEDYKTRRGEEWDDCVARVLLDFDRGPDLSIKNDAGHTPLDVAVLSRNRRAAELFWERQLARLPVAERKDLSNIGYAAMRYDITIVRTLMFLDRTGKFDVCDSQKRTPLFGAAEAGFTWAVEELLKRKADPLIARDVDSEKTTPMEIAVKKGHIGIALMIMRYIRDPTEAAKLRDGESGDPLSTLESVLFDASTFPREDFAGRQCLAEALLARDKAKYPPNGLPSLLSKAIQARQAYATLTLLSDGLPVPSHIPTEDAEFLSIITSLRPHFRPDSSCTTPSHHKKPHGTPILHQLALTPYLPLLRQALARQPTRSVNQSYGPHPPFTPFQRALHGSRPANAGALLDAGADPFLARSFSASGSYPSLRLDASFWTLAAPYPELCARLVTLAEKKYVDKRKLFGKPEHTHFSLPLTAARKGGWVETARVVAEAFAERVVEDVKGNRMKREEALEVLEEFPEARERFEVKVPGKGKEKIKGKEAESGGIGGGCG
ncbi:ankyrin [Glonium stellatum]|uniref:Ankyrin n=1 Tax=Glonium stellatum TaxID=574774 RepID=A0A8E2F8H6_9PEZI|nr:ankyrin [Glonium stellatum]